MTELKKVNFLVNLLIHNYKYYFVKKMMLLTTMIHSFIIEENLDIHDFYNPQDLQEALSPGASLGWVSPGAKVQGVTPSISSLREPPPRISTLGCVYIYLKYI
ncbi:unnamed protein product [Meganyctiphanes norvegica]|uniref:Uncharacterized protein n=1 Tax=Meganyctiphanes norvegica TaxID=48144 RepID=A0AAV2QM87_MEGNR